MFPSLLWGQQYAIMGYVKHAQTGEPIPFANLFLEEEGRGTVTDENGFFQLTKVATHQVTISVTYLSCLPKQVELEVQEDTTVAIFLNENTNQLTEVLVADRKATSLQASEQINRDELEQQASKKLAEVLESVVGVSNLKTGANVAKPVIHGLFGSRIAILNNGVIQEGQQWGDDHSPAVDPLFADQITVIKGVSALAYQGSTLGGLIKLNPKKIAKQKGITGRTSYFFNTNGLGHGLHAQVQQYTPVLAWKIAGTLKKNGDQSTSNYFLNNTGTEEANIAIQLERSFGEKWHHQLYFSSFNTRLGILRGTHIGNTTDLTSALSRSEPFFTEPDFSYEIAAPRQEVNHHLWKWHSSYWFNDRTWLEMTYSGQWDSRKEFDVRRGGRSDKPSLDLSQVSHFVEAKYQQIFSDYCTIKAGVQHTNTSNKNDAGTGILPLIPDYLRYKIGAFAVAQAATKHWSLEFGARYDFVLQNVAAISRDLPRRILRYQNPFHQFSAAVGVQYQPNKTWSIQYNLGYASRPPSINELYSNGLHQGLASMEIGDPNLEVEQGIKTTLGAKVNLLKSWSIEALAYYQHLDNFIYLSPTNELELTIRGAFPVFHYTQTEAQIFGLDLQSTYNISKNWRLEAKYSYLRGNDLTEKMPLIDMPANNLQAAIHYQLQTLGPLEKFECSLEVQHVFRQNHLLLEQDFVASPSAYTLLDAKVSANYPLKKGQLKFYVQGENLLNVAYRDYLNRQRYFADDLGINITVGATWTF